MCIDIKRILKDVIRQLERVSESEPRERLFQERQLQCALYHSLCKKKGFSVHPEAGYFADRRQKYCDLVVTSPNRCQTWIELKIATHSNHREHRHILHNAPAKFFKSWKKDEEKLKEAPGGARKMFILLGLFDEAYEHIRQSFRGKVDGFGENKILVCSPDCDLNWPDIQGQRNLEIHGKFWVWEW